MFNDSRLQPSWLLALGLLVSPLAMAEVKFVPLKPAAANSDQEYYSLRPDFAAVERVAPLTPADRNSLTPAVLKSYNQEQLDQVYGRLTSGPIPQGDFTGYILLKNEMTAAIEKKIMDSILERKIFHGIVHKAALKVICGNNDRVECLGQFLWKGKHFYPANAEGAVELRNAINTNLGSPTLLKLAGLGGLAEPLKAARIDLFNNEKRMMLFPANVFCGISLLDTRHESIIIDYAYGDDFKPFIPELDGIVGRNGKWIRDEIRMVRPGLYLGRAYVENLFLLNFVLESKAPVQNWKDSCWSGNSWQ